MVTYTALVAIYQKNSIPPIQIIQTGTVLIPQGEIVNILLKIKNSFLPTKQILIGL